MRMFSASDCLMLWERGAALHAIDRALLMLRCGLPEADHESLVRLPLGQRDRHLIDLRRNNFGDRMEAFAQCPTCRERVEFALSCAVLLEITQGACRTVQPIVIQGIPYQLRCLDSADAAIAASSVRAGSAVNELLARCLRGADDGDVAIEALTVAQRRAIAAELAARDPAAEILLDLVCPVCGDSWEMLFDINHVLWSEIRARARRLLQEVDALARVYGWNEAEILGMSETRRGLYLEMALS